MEIFLPVLGDYEMRIFPRMDVIIHNYNYNLSLNRNRVEHCYV